MKQVGPVLNWHSEVVDLKPQPALSSAQHPASLHSHRARPDHYIPATRDPWWGQTVDRMAWERAEGLPMEEEEA